ncbi:MULTISPECIES: Ppx/GppA phosphatase family protein [unclassified Nocardia]|uniref:Ppx/GppA phosphatase family protein n=1 Tax=unclassified Nocardia TaxID=2637762 RepID=UPI002E22EA25|nr:Ppx/GppA family phosphatase [Nocardia sp. NBC_01009]
MRLGVLDVGSNTVHLLVVDAHRGGHPMPMSSTKATLRLSENMDGAGRITVQGAERLIATVAEFASIAETSKCVELMPFATSALREATNSEEVLARVLAEAGVELRVLSGVDEARSTFLAVRRWYGWSAGRILNLDIGGGSLEMTNGGDEEPDVALSLQLGAGRLTREWLREDPPGKRRVAVLRDWLDAELVLPTKQLLDAGKPDLAVGTSKTFRSLARLTGAAPSSAGLRVRRTLTSSGLRQLIAFISRMTASDRAELEGVSSDRSQQLVAGALVAEASMRALSLDTLEICPWALREGLILRKLDTDMNGGPRATSSPGPAAETGRPAPGGGAALSGPIETVSP